MNPPFYRAISVDSLDARPPPTSPSIPPYLRLLKNNPLFSSRGSEDRPAPVSIPLRPHPIKTTPSNISWPLPERSDWVPVVNTGTSGGMVVSLNLKHDSSSPILHFSSLVPPGLESHLPSRSPGHPRPICLRPRSAFDLTDSNNGKEKRTPPSSWTNSQHEGIFGKNIRGVDEEAPLDLSSASGPKIIETDVDLASSSSSSPPAPLSSPSSAQYCSSPQSDLQSGDTKPQVLNTILYLFLNVRTAEWNTFGIILSSKNILLQAAILYTTLFIIMDVSKKKNKTRLHSNLYNV